MMQNKNQMKLEFSARSENESFARVAVASFFARLNMTLDELEEIKTAVSEAVTNAIIHGYEENGNAMVSIAASYDEQGIEIVIEDQGQGISDVDEARQPLFTTKPELERSGMGFTIMENFMDSIEVVTGEQQGTRIILRKKTVENNAVYN